MSKTLAFFKSPPQLRREGCSPLLTTIGVFLLKPVFVPHSSYQSFILESLHQYYSGDILVLRNRDWPIICKLFITDLSHATTLLRDSYDDKGPEPRDPASMLRSYLLFLLTRPEIGITKWVDRMYSIPLYAILSGFEPGDIPGVGTFYDFLSRFWSADENNIKPRKKPKKRKPKKGKKGEKSPISNSAPFPLRIPRGYYIIYIKKQNKVLHLLRSNVLYNRQHEWICK